MSSDQIDTLLKILLILSQALVVGLTAYFSGTQAKLRAEVQQLQAEIIGLKAHVIVLTAGRTIGAKPVKSMSEGL